MKLFENPKFIKSLCIFTFFIAVLIECGMGIRLVQAGNKLGIIFLITGGIAALASLGMFLILTIKKMGIKKWM